MRRTRSCQPCTFTKYNWKRQMDYIHVMGYSTVYTDRNAVQHRKRNGCTDFHSSQLKIHTGTQMIHYAQRMMIRRILEMCIRYIAVTTHQQSILVRDQTMKLNAKKPRSAPEQDTKLTEEEERLRKEELAQATNREYKKA
eukprot:734815_1